MKTITFYSYKGGVGRSLALSNIAIRLSELNKKVCVLDFDLDAPGLRFKFPNYILSQDISRGIVDYIYEFSSEGKTDNNISDFCVDFLPPNDLFTAINFISAGDIHSRDYWQKLSMIKWSEMFYGENPNGVKFFLDLKSRIEKEIEPDYLLIDSRTGITDISGITLRLLADHAVVLAVNNQENLFGSKKIIKNLLGKSFPGSEPKVNFVLTRLPYTVAEIELEKKVVENIQEEFEAFLNIDNFPISVIHSDVRLQIEESHLIGRKHEEKSVIISNDYMNLFDLLTKDSLNMDDRAIKTKEAEIEYSKYLNLRNVENDKSLLLKQISKAIDLDNSKYMYYAYRGIEYYRLQNNEAAIKDYLEAIRLNPRDSVLHFNLAHFYMHAESYEKALQALKFAESYGDQTFILQSQIYSILNQTDKAIESLDKALEINPINDVALNSRGHLHRMNGNLKQAFEDVSKAIGYNADQPVYFATLAEIYAAEGKLDEFYLNLSIALSKKLTLQSLRLAKDIYSKFVNDDRFKILLSKHNMSIDDVL